MKKRWHMLGVMMVVCALSFAATGQSVLLEDSFDVRLESIAEGLTAPVALVSSLDGSGRLFVVDQVGLVRIIAANGDLLEQPFIDVRDLMVPLMDSYDERGLLGLAFHPDFIVNGKFYLYYSAPLRAEGRSGWNHTSRVSEFSVLSTDADLADPSSERIVLEVDQPQFNHNGGDLLFGPDGYLYIALGDGGAANDVGEGHPPMGNGQDRSTLLGSILRIDIDSETEPYGIPSDNPFVGEAGRDEIYSYGLRNPYRMAFDTDGFLYVGDVGQDLWEEVDIIVPGGNYGWNLREGTHCFDPQQPGESPIDCTETSADGDPLLSPVIEYGHPGNASGIGLSVIGGFVYRGAGIPELAGLYLFGDWGTSFTEPSGSLWIGKPAGTDELWDLCPVLIANREGGELDAFVLGLGTDEDGELYVLTSRGLGPTGSSGAVHKLVAADGGMSTSITDIDGKIGPDEYAHSTKVAGVDVYWANDAHVIAVGLRSPGRGFVSIGFDPDFRMRGAAFVVGAVVNGEVRIRDDYGSGSINHQSDVSLGGSDDVLEAAGSEGDDGTVIEFVFPLNTGDEYDKILSPGDSVPIIVAYHASSDSFDAYHGSSERGSGSIMLD